MTKGQTKIYKTLQQKLKIEQPQELVRLHFTEIRINIAKVRLVKSIGGLHCELLLITPFLFFKFLYKPKYILSG
jgi:hypothetical protein